MSHEENYEELICALSDAKHFVQEPIVLTSCGHSVCKNCLPKSQEKQAIQCKICQIVTERDFSNDKESLAVKRLLKVYLGDLHSFLEKETSFQLNKIKDYLNNKKEAINLKIQYIEDEIIIRIESLKIQLDELGDKMKRELAEVKCELISSNEDNLKQYEDHDRLLNELRDDIRNKEKQSEEKFYNYQLNLLNLRTKIQKLDELTHELDFKVSTETVNERLIGETEYGYSVKNILKNSPFETISLDFSPYDVCSTPDNSLIFANYRDSTLRVYDKDLNYMKTVSKIGDLEFKPVAIACNTNDNDKIYVLDNKNDRVIMANLELTLVMKQTSLRIQLAAGEQEQESQHVNPWDLCYENNQLFICDSGNKRIQIYDASNLLYLKVIRLDFSPSRIRVVRQEEVKNKKSILLCIYSSSTSKIYFYNNIDDDMSLIRKSIHDHRGRIVPLSTSTDNYFYNFNYKSKSICCYTSSGILNEDISVSRFTNNNDICADDGIIFFHKKKLHFTLYKEKKIIKFII